MKQQFNDALLAWYFVVVWGSGFIATKIGIQYAAPFTFLSLRFAFGILCLIPLVLWLKPSWPRTAQEWLHIVVAGLLMHAIHLSGSHYAQYLGMSAGIAAVIQLRDLLYIVARLGDVWNPRAARHPSRAGVISRQAQLYVPAIALQQSF